MMSPSIAEALARYRQEDLSAEATRVRDARTSRLPRRHRLPPRDGWWTMHARLQVAFSEPRSTGS
jgi:hypothetical protein